ncbi:MAG: ABC transporter ATP-binding protein [Sulfolobales archaeon]
MTQQKIIIEMIGIEKIYPDGQYALRGVDLSVEEGEIHGILGENGAGKTSLMRILYGEIKPTRGIIKIFGKVTKFRGPWDAIKHGIGMIYQNFSLVPTFTVGENLYLSLLSIRKSVRYEDAIDLAERYSKALGFKLPYEEYVEDLPVGIQQRVEIVKTLMRGARVLILDEPTSVLNPLEVRELFNILRRLKEKNYSMIYITHRLREIKEIADRVTVLRRGRVAGVFNDLSRVSEEELAKAMVQIEAYKGYESKIIDKNIDTEKILAESSESILEVSDLWVRDQRGFEVVRGISIKVFRGEILGIAGIQGNGQTELSEALAGVRKIERGKIFFKGIDITHMNPYKRYSLGISFIPESRDVGLVHGMSIVENIILTNFREYLNRIGMIRWRDAARKASEIVEKFKVVARSLDTDVRYLSGGNQQKLMLGREISREPDLIIVSEPTRGLDIMSTRYIRDLLRNFRNRGRSIILFSSDLDEIFELSDRIAVMNRGEIKAVGKPHEFTLERLGVLMGG